MTKGVWSLLAGGAIVALAAGVITAKDRQPPRAAAANADDSDKDRAADREAVAKSSREFAEAFANGDAKAVAAFWTEKGEYQEEGREALRGREAIEKTFAEFFKEKPKGKIEVRIESIRFPAPDLAVEEGVLRQIPGGKGLPSSSLYSAIHVRDGGGWKIAVSREWGAGQDRLEDLEWLFGSWKGGQNGKEVVLTLERDAKRGCISGQITQKNGDKVASSGMLRIGVDPQRGQLRSWHFDDNGGHGQSLWLRDGNRWVMDAFGVLGDGTDTESVNIIVRTGKDTFTWQSIDRVVAADELPDTPPIKLTRLPASK